MSKKRNEGYKNSETSGIDIMCCHYDFNYHYTDIHITTVITADY